MRSTCSVSLAASEARCSSPPATCAGAAGQRRRRESAQGAAGGRSAGGQLARAPAVPRAAPPISAGSLQAAAARASPRALPPRAPRTLASSPCPSSRRRRLGPPGRRAAIFSSTPHSASQQLGMYLVRLRLRCFCSRAASARVILVLSCAAGRRGPGGGCALGGWLLAGAACPRAWPPAPRRAHAARLLPRSASPGPPGPQRRLPLPPDPAPAAHLQAALLQGVLHGRHHLCHVVADVLLACALEGDLGADDAHKHAHLMRCRKAGGSGCVELGAVAAAGGSWRTQRGRCACRWGWARAQAPGSAPPCPAPG
jgi:hypothetical protein